MSLRILVVEDELAIASGLCDALRMQGYDPAHCADGQAGQDAACSGDYALVLLDVMLPSVDGFHICQVLRAQCPQQAIMMLTAKGSEADIVRGFECGADDYMSKPFSLKELMLRIAALLRRTRVMPSVDDADGRSVKEQGIDEHAALQGVAVCMQTLSVSCGGQAVAINRRDADILAVFAREQGHIVSRRLLLREVWGFAQPDMIETRSVDMHMVKLRKKLVRIGATAGIETVRGEGYRWSVR